MLVRNGIHATVSTTDKMDLKFIRDVVNYVCIQLEACMRKILTYYIVYIKYYIELQIN